MAGARPRLGLLCLPRTVESAVADARLAGIDGLLVTGFVAERTRLIRALGEQVLPLLGAA